ncbi:metallophosphoesterase, partial [bacterium]|nr:metallophosphoesterase [bacterium]
GIIGVAGNHDHMDSIDPITASMRKNNIAVINNSKKTIAKDGDIISILGVDDIWFVEPKTEKVLRNIKPENFTILVSHNPDFFIGNSFDKKIDLGLSGHTHGGQVTFFGLFAPYVPIESSHKYRTGLFHEPEMDLIVSNGIGTVMLPIRFFAPPQIVLIELNN